MVQHPVQQWMVEPHNPTQQQSGYLDNRHWGTAGPFTLEAVTGSTMFSTTSPDCGVVSFLRPLPPVLVNWLVCQYLLHLYWRSAGGQSTPPGHLCSWMCPYGGCAECWTLIWFLSWMLHCFILCLRASFVMFFQTHLQIYLDVTTNYCVIKI